MTFPIRENSPEPTHTLQVLAAKEALVESMRASRLPQVQLLPPASDPLSFEAELSHASLLLPFEHRAKLMPVPEWRPELSEPSIFAAGTTVFPPLKGSGETLPALRVSSLNLRPSLKPAGVLEEPRVCPEWRPKLPASWVGKSLALHVKINPQGWLENSTWMINGIEEPLRSQLTTWIQSHRWPVQPEKQMRSGLLLIEAESGHD